MRYYRSRTIIGVAGLTVALAACAGHSTAGASPGRSMSPSSISARAVNRIPVRSLPASGRPALDNRTSALLVDSTDSRPSSSASNPPTPTAAQLESALLTLADMPDASFQVLPPIDDSDASLLSSCPFATQDQATPSADVEADFGTSLIGPDIITEDLQQYSVGVAEAQLQQFAETAFKCSTFTTVVDKFSVAVFLAPEAIPRFGDETVALSLIADVRLPRINLSTTTDLVAVREGGTVMIIVNTAPQLDHTETTTLVRTAYQRLAALYPPGS